jgi:hypothetical protein
VSKKRQTPFAPARTLLLEREDVMGVMSTSELSRSIRICACAGGHELAHPHSPDPCSHVAEVIVEPNAALCWTCYPRPNDEKQASALRARRAAFALQAHELVEGA